MILLIRMKSTLISRVGGTQHGREAVKVAREANVKQTILFHHDPSHNDQKMDQIASDAAKELESARPCN